MSGALQAVGDRDFDQVVQSSSVPVLVEFWKPGCGHCRALSRELEKVQQAAGSRVLILRMNTEEHHQIPAELEITTLPALALFERGAFKRFIGGIGKQEEILKQVELDVNDGAGA